jgi:hypothetical protein
MDAVTVLQRRLSDAGSMAVLLDAAWDVFEVIIAASGDCAECGDEFFTPLVYALAAAADGRDAITTAPSLPGRPAAEAPTSRAGPLLTARSEVADLAALSDQLAVRLVSAASTANDPGDQAACLLAARYALEIHALLAGARA